LKGKIFNQLLDRSVIAIWAQQLHQSMLNKSISMIQVHSDSTKNISKISKNFFDHRILLPEESKKKKFTTRKNFEIIVFFYINQNTFLEIFWSSLVILFDF